MIDQQPEAPATTTSESSRSGLYLLLGAFGLLLIPVVIGFVMANTESGGTDDASGMEAAGTVIVPTTADPGGAPDGAFGAINLAIGATVTGTSSEFNENFAGGNAIDGSLSTEWSSRGDGDDAYIIIDLGSPAAVTGFGFRTREMSDGSAITNSYTVSVDGGEPLGPFPAGLGLVTSAHSAAGQVFRFDLDQTTGGNTGAVEIEIYGG